MKSDRDLISRIAGSVGESRRDTAGTYDSVINRIFGTGLTLAGILSLERVDAEVAGRLRDAIDALDVAVGELRTAALAEAVADDSGLRDREPARARTPAALRR